MTSQPTIPQIEIHVAPKSGNESFGGIGTEHLQETLEAVASEEFQRRIEGRILADRGEEFFRPLEFRTRLEVTIRDGCLVDIAYDSESDEYAAYISALVAEEIAAYSSESSYRDMTRSDASAPAARRSRRLVSVASTCALISG